MPYPLLAELIPVQLNDEQLGGLVRKTTVLLNCVGPYHLYSSPVVKACAVNGTHYVDVYATSPNLFLSFLQVYGAYS